MKVLPSALEFNIWGLCRSRVLHTSKWANTWTLLLDSEMTGWRKKKEDPKKQPHYRLVDSLFYSGTLTCRLFTGSFFFSFGVLIWKKKKVFIFQDFRPREPPFGVAAGENRLQVHLQQEVHTGRLSDMASAQSGMCHITSLSKTTKRKWKSLDCDRRITLNVNTSNDRASCNSLE